MPAPKAHAPVCWIIGYGNPQRRDDGLGPYIAERLRHKLSADPDLCIRSIHQLDPVLLEEIHAADHIIFIDAAMNNAIDEVRIQHVEPKIETGAFISHLFSPPSLLGLLRSWYGCCPDAWLVSVQGEDFEYGEGLSLAATSRAEKAADAIAGFNLCTWIYETRVEKTKKQITNRSQL